MFQVLSLLVSQLADETDGVARPELHITQNNYLHFSRRNGLTLLDNGTSAHERVGAHVASLLENGSHADQRVVLHGAGVEHGAVTDGDVAADGDGSVARVVLLGGNHHSTVLDVRVFANHNFVLVAYASPPPRKPGTSHNGIVPDRGAGGHLHITDNGRVGSDKSGCVYGRAFIIDAHNGTVTRIYSLTAHSVRTTCFHEFVVVEHSHSGSLESLASFTESLSRLCPLQRSRDGYQVGELLEHCDVLVCWKLR